MDTKPPSLLTWGLSKSDAELLDELVGATLVDRIDIPSDQTPNPISGSIVIVGRNAFYRYLEWVENYEGIYSISPEPVLLVDSDLPDKTEITGMRSYADGVVSHQHPERLLELLDYPYLLLAEQAAADVPSNFLKELRDRRVSLSTIPARGFPFENAEWQPADSPVRERLANSGSFRYYFERLLNTRSEWAITHARAKQKVSPLDVIARIVVTTRADWKDRLAVVVQLLGGFVDQAQGEPRWVPTVYSAPTRGGAWQSNMRTGDTAEEIGAHSEIFLPDADDDLAEFTALVKNGLQFTDSQYQFDAIVDAASQILRLENFTDSTHVHGDYYYVYTVELLWEGGQRKYEAAYGFVKIPLADLQEAAKSELFSFALLVPSAGSEEA